MNINIKKSFLYHFVLLFVISGCSFNVIDYSNIKDKNFKLSFSSDIPNELQTKIRTVFSRSDPAEDKYSDFIKISEFTIETYDIFSGKALRALEVEVKSSVLLSISTNSKTKNKKLMTMKRYNANELNILAEKEMLDFIKEEIYKDFVNQILIEVNLIEM